MSKKSSFVRSLFGVPVPYDSVPERKTELLVVDSDDSGNSVVHAVCVEDVMDRLVNLNFYEVNLSNLVSKGIEPHSLDMIDSSKLGIDEGVDRLAQHLVSHSELYVESSKSE